MPRTRRFLDVPLVYALATLAIFSATRLGLALWTGTSAVPLSEWLTVFAKGLWFDLKRLAASGLLPAIVERVSAQSPQVAFVISEHDILDGIAMSISSR